MSQKVSIPFSLLYPVSAMELKVSLAQDAMCFNYKDMTSINNECANMHTLNKLFRTFLCELWDIFCPPCF